MFIHPRRSARYAFCCGHDRRPGHGVVLMIVDGQAEAETIGVEFRQRGVHADVVRSAQVPIRCDPDTAGGGDRR
jgi:hypothetical protein